MRAGGGFSPDGEYVWFTSAESGRTEVYVEALPPAFGKWQISIHGGSQPRWRGDGRELFFLALDGKLMAADTRTGPSVTAGVPHPRFQTAASVRGPGQPSYDVTSDGCGVHWLAHELPITQFKLTVLPFRQLTATPAPDQGRA